MRGWEVQSLSEISYIVQMDREQDADGTRTGAKQVKARHGLTLNPIARDDF